MNPQNQSNLELTHLAPTVASDGNAIFISNDGNIPTISFFQVRRQFEDRVQADVVASVRFNNLEDLKALRAAIDETIANHSQREA